MNTGTIALLALIIGAFAGFMGGTRLAEMMGDQTIRVIHEPTTVAGDGCGCIPVLSPARKK